MSGLPTGDYTVRFRPCYAGESTQNLRAEYYDDAVSADEADPVPVESGATTPDINATLAEGARISGHVTAGDTGNPVDGICVSASTVDGSFGSDDVTDSDGYYTIPALAPGEYVIRFGSCGAGDYLPEFWENAYTIGKASPFAASAGDNTANAVLELGSSISGRVTGPGDEPAEGVCVDLLDAETREYLTGRQTDEEGEYTIPVHAGEVKVQFSNCGSGSYLSEYYDDARRFGGATAVTVVSNAPTEDIDASLALGASIAGTVTGPGGDPYDDACVRALDSDDEPFNGRSTGTDGDGRYRLGGLPPGEYKLRFIDCGGGGFASEWWDDKPSRAAADPIVVAGAEQVTDIDAELAEAGNGAIQGAVSEPDGGDSSDACVGVFDAQTGEQVSGGNVQGGVYRISRLPAGDYKVGFQSCGANLAMEFYGGPGSDGVRTLGEAAVLQLDAGETISGIDAALAVGSRIRGRVTGPDGEGVADACVDVYDDTDSDVRFASNQTRQDGSFTVDGLQPGDYKLHFDPDCNGGASRLTPEYWDNQSSFAAATTVELAAAGATVSAINAQLAAEPPVTVTSGPPQQTADRRPDFEFSTPGGADLECSIDTGTPQWVPCSGPNSHTPAADLANGSYTFRVRATTDWDQTVATRAFTVAGAVVDAPDDSDPDPEPPADPNPPADPPKDTRAPVLEITKAPKSKTRDRTPTFAFTADEAGSVFACAVDDEKAKACSSPTTLKKLSRGKHTFTVVAADRAGNFSKPVAVEFKVKKKKRR